MAALRNADVMQRLESLKVTPVWVDPNHLVESARVLMDGHDLSAICILDRDAKPIGILRRDIAANIPSNARVGEVMEPVLGILDSSETLRQAADLLVRIERHYAPMVDGTEFRGMVTALDLLDGLRRSWDPMTDLPWSDELRRWGAEMLDSGREIAVLFIDLDRFGTFNKRFGHVVGDRVLTRMAAFLREETDPARDVLVRYGGDEFAIGTLRTAPEAQALADSLLTISRETPLKESGEAISFSIGVYGGQRQRERDDIHVQATLDDLINLASRRCVAGKGAAGLADGAPSAAPAAEEPSLPAFMARPSREDGREEAQSETTDAAEPASDSSHATAIEELLASSDEVPATDESAGPTSSSDLEGASTVEELPIDVPIDIPVDVPGEIQPDAPIVAPAELEIGAADSESAPEETSAETVAEADASPNLAIPERDAVEIDVAETSPVEEPPVEEPHVVEPSRERGDVESAPETVAPSTPAAETPSVVEVQIEDDPNSLTHVVLKGGGRVWVGVGLRLGRTLESTVAYATGKALERAYTGRTLRIDAVREQEGRFVVEGIRSENGQERPVSAVAEDNTPEAVADATIAAFLA